jgi:hypothetical protein
MCSSVHFALDRKLSNASKIIYESTETGDGNFTASFANGRRWGTEGSLAAKRRKKHKREPLMGDYFFTANLADNLRWGAVQGVRGLLTRFVTRIFLELCLALFRFV